MALWDSYIKGFKAYLQLERSMSDNTVAAYEHDVNLLASFFTKEENTKSLESIQLEDLQKFLVTINEMELSAGTQARVLSGIKSFFRFLLLEDILKNGSDRFAGSSQTEKKTS